ncbi:serine hydrolase [Allocoleopsis sp.]|uniref:serine hydrolase domain-containing protein n=1 Tax=Allocoleopsis sp. TaxID=3088169 RepID=UPI002FD6AD0C
MVTQSKTFTASEIGLMRGFPPPPDKRVTHDNQLLSPYTRWSFQNSLKLNCAAEVWRGNQPVAEMEYALRDLHNVSYQDWSGDWLTFDDMIELSYTDGIVVLHHGKIIYERYLNGMQPHTLHAWASASKSMTGTIALMLAHEGLFDLDEAIVTYLPELQHSGFGNATVRQVMEMTTAVTYADTSGNTENMVTENWQYAIAMGWHPKPVDYTGPETCYDLLPTMKKEGEHGVRFTYQTPNTDVLAWLIKRLCNQSLAEVMQERIWSKLGVERDAFWLVGPAAVETAGSGLITTLRDMARFGQMLLQKGQFNGQQIVPRAVIEAIEQGGDPDAFARGPAASPMSEGYSYHHQWWMAPRTDGAYYALGYAGQHLYIQPKAQLVVAKFASYPVSAPNGEEFYSAFAAFPSLAKALT